MKIGTKNLQNANTQFLVVHLGVYRKYDKYETIVL